MSMHFNAKFWRLLNILGYPKPTMSASSAPRKPQRLSWNVPAEVEFGTLMNAIPDVVVDEGNQDATPIYTPPRSQRRPAAGNRTLTVTVPGNDEYEEASLSKPQLVKRGNLTVTGPQLTIEVGAPLPAFTCTVDGAAVAPDVVETSVTHKASSATANMAGYPLMPEVNFTAGFPHNYDITIVPGCLKVRPTAEQMRREENIGIFRRRALQLKDKNQQGQLFEILDKIAEKRITIGDDALAELLAQLETELIDAEYNRVKQVTIDPGDGARIEALETMQFTATVLPQDAEQPGIHWSVDDPSLATISETGLLTRVGKAGGSVIVTATSLCKDGIIASAAVYIRPRPQSIRLKAPPHIFLDKQESLEAVIDPPEADQSVEWFKEKGAPQNLTFETNEEKATVKIREVQHSGKNKGEITLWAQSAVDPTVEARVTIPFDGHAVDEFQFTYQDNTREVNVGESVTITAKAFPPKASQDLAWELEDPSMADMTVEDRTVTLVTKAGGTVYVICKSLDGGGYQAKARVKAKVQLDGLSTTCAKTEIDITESLQFTPAFVPSDARARVTWTVVPEDVATISAAGKLTPLKVGMVTVTAKTEDPEFSHAETITVTASPTSAIGIDHWETLLPRIDAFADRLMIPQHHLSKAAYKTWKANLRNTLEGGATKTLGAMKTELIDLRNQHFQYNHSQWLTKAGFARATNCCIRNDGQLNVANRQFRVHLTMFPTATQFTVGTPFDTLRDDLYRVGDTGFVSMHATLYVSNANNDEQVKVYASGENYVSRFSFVQNWANQGINYQLLKTELAKWMTNVKNQATTELQGVYNQVHAGDSQSIL